MNGISSIDAAVRALAAGRMAIVVDSPDRENEGDLVLAAERATPQAINFMIRFGRGLVCAPMRACDLDRLRIPPMVGTNTDPKGTAFHVSVDLRAGTSTGISAPDRAATLRALADPRAASGDFTRPGHVFPLAARAGGVLERRGHTEASVELVERAGLRPAAVICEIVDEDGEMARLPRLLELARDWAMPLVTIEDLVQAVERERVPPRQLRLSHG